MSRISSRVATITASAPAEALYRAIPILGFAALTAVAARVQLPLGPVPSTLQPAAVLLAGLVLGARAGAASQAVYLLAGFAGLPAFALGGGPGYLLLPTAGFLLGFPLAAWLAGRLGAGGSWRRAALGALAGLAAIHLAGFVGLTAHGLAAGLGNEAPLRALQVGFLPFLLADPLKLLLAASLGPLATRWRRR